MGALLLAALAVAPACGDTPVPHGAPVLLQVYWQLPLSSAAVFCPKAKTPGQCLVWSKDDPDPDDPVAPSVPAAPQQFNLVFDRVLDGSKIETTVTDAGISRQVPVSADKTPLTVSTPDATMPLPASVMLAVWYNSAHLPFAGASTSYVYGRETPAFPSGTTLLIQPDKTRLTSVYNEPADVPSDPIPVTTAPFSLATVFTLPDGGMAPTLPGGAAVAPSYRLPLQFSNQPAELQFDNQPPDLRCSSQPAGAQTVVPQHVHVTSGGAAVPFQLVPDPLDPTLIQVEPLDRGLWPKGVPIEVTVDADLPDVFCSRLGVPATTGFVACDLDATGKNCLSGPDAGAATDAGVDAPVE